MKRFLICVLATAALGGVVSLLALEVQFIFEVVTP